MKMIQGKIYIRSGKISGIENEGGYVSIISESSEIKFDNCYAFPGLTDHHGHIVGLGTKLRGLDLESCRSPEECCLQAEKYDSLDGDFLQGRGWNEQLWHPKELPSKKILDYYFPDIPVCFIRVDGHAAWVNSKALELSEIDDRTKNPEGGIIMRDRNGNATGILIDNAMNLVRRLIKEPNENQIRNFIKAANDSLMRAGIVCVHDMDVPSNYLPVFRDMDMRGELGIKIRSFISSEAIDWNNIDLTPRPDTKFSIQGLKFYADGALGSRGAWLLNEYKDRSGYKGLCLINRISFIEECRKGLQKGLDIAVHAIGDAANRYVLDVFENFYQKHPGKLRIEHAQIVHPDDQKRFADMGIIASIQPIHCISDIKMAEDRLNPDTLEYSYPWMSLQDKGVKIISGSDFPIESHNPFMGIAALSDTLTGFNHPQWHEKEVISIEKAIMSYVSSGSTTHIDAVNPLSIGSAADILILPEKTSLKNIQEFEPLAVIVDGKIVADYREIIS